MNWRIVASNLNDLLYLNTGQREGIIEHLFEVSNMYLFIFIAYSNMNLTHIEHDLETWLIKPNLDSNYIFLIDLAANGISFVPRGLRGALNPLCRETRVSRTESFSFFARLTNAPHRAFEFFWQMKNSFFLLPELFWHQIRTYA